MIQDVLSMTGASPVTTTLTTPLRDEVMRSRV